MPPTFNLKLLFLSLPIKACSIRFSRETAMAKELAAALIFTLWLPAMLLWTSESASPSTVHLSSPAPAAQVSGRSRHYNRHLAKLQKLKASLPVRRDSLSIAPTPTPPSFQAPGGARVYHVTAYGADPTGRVDSTESLLRALSDAYGSPGEGWLMDGIRNLGGAHINLDGGNYLISRPLRLPGAGVGNIVIQGGSLRASDDFPSDGYLIDLSPSSSSSPSSPVAKIKKQKERKSMEVVKLASSSSYNYEYITFRDLLLDSNYRGGGISIINSLRTSIDNCYITHFTTTGISVQSGHETFIRSSFLGQHITAGADPGERNFSGTGISLIGNDNSVTDVVVFSAATAILVSGQANILTGVHCYNKATGFGGTGIYLKLPGLTQTRIVNSYMDYTGIVAEDPVQLHISNTFFLGDASITLKSINGVVNGLNIVDNMFSGSDRGVPIVKLDQSKSAFREINQVVIERNNARGMQIKSTAASAESQGNGTSWIIDFNPILLFPNLIRNVQYSFRSSGEGFPKHVVRNVSENRVVIESDVAVAGSVFATVDQGHRSTDELCI
ncbi:polygalacturonase QRT3-like isoform X2 [Momordica charantia]|uniref:Polygalacturonase QRT3-like isoform X2 n=1 Tax=Momordica charantia TaxID=3673 RepID=A0A6J1CYV3_MOMCH|nr:polygalacturonase QRT3-like isoform X2 [Momordica charantia]